MGSEPLISVCIPSYNNEEFIGLTVESILNQTYRNFEVVITDDHSKDGTAAAIRKFNDPRIRLIENEANLGMGGNWNKALSFATGKYVKLMCGDDVAYAECFSRQVAALENPAHARAVLAICNTNVINARSDVVLRRRPRFRAGLATGRTLIRKCVRSGTNLIGEPVAGLFKRELLDKSVRFDPSNPYMIDLAFWADALKHGDAVMDNERLAAFRISAGSVSAKTGLKQAANFRRFVHQIRADPVYRASRLDVMLGCALSVPWCILRNLLIRFRAGTPAVAHALL